MTWQLLSDPSLSSRLCVTLLHSLWQVALFAIVAVAVTRLRRNRSVERDYAIYFVALLASVVVMTVTFVAVTVANTPNSAETAAVQSTPLSPDKNVSTSFEGSGSTSTSETGSGVGTFSSSRSTSIAAQPLQNAQPGWPDFSPWIAAFYGVGVALMLVRLGLGVWHANRLGRRGHILRDGPLVELVRTVAANWQMRVVPKLVQIEEIVVPKVVGLVWPKILLPAAALTGLSPADLEMLIIHELAHLRRHDMWVNLLQRLAEAILFFHPATWFLSRRLSHLREFCCDEMACRTMSPTRAESRTEYALALLRIVELARGSARIPASDGLAALAAGGRSPSQLRQRVASLFGEPIRDPLRLSAGGMLTVVALALLLLLGPASWHVDANSDDTETVESTEGPTAEDSATPNNEYERRAAQLYRREHPIDPLNLKPGMLGTIDASGIVLNSGLDGLFANSNFHIARLQYVTISGGRTSYNAARFSSAKMIGAKIAGGDASFQKANFYRAELADAELRGGISAFQGASFNLAEMRRIKLSGGPSSFQGASFITAHLAHATLAGEGTAFQEAKFDDADLSGAKILCSGPAFQGSSISGTIFYGANLSSISVDSLASCVFPANRPPRYDQKTRFPKGFEPTTHSWRFVQDITASRKLSKHVVMLQGESRPQGYFRFGPALVIACDGKTSTLLSTSWNAEPFPGPGVVPLGALFLHSTYDEVKIVAYDMRLGIGIFTVDVPLEPISAADFAEDVVLGDELVELRLSDEDPERLFEALAVDVPYKYAWDPKLPVTIEHAIRIHGEFHRPPSSILLKNGKIAAFFLNNDVNFPDGERSFALPITYARKAFAQLTSGNKSNPPSQQNAKPTADEPQQIKGDKPLDSSPATESSTGKAPEIRSEAQPTGGQPGNATKLDAAFEIEGVYKAPDDMPLASVRVRLFTAASQNAVPHQISETQSDSEGNFHFFGLKQPVYAPQEGKYRMYAVVATAVGHASAIDQIFTPETRFRRLVLYKAGTLQWRVTNENGEPVSRAQVFFGGINGRAVRDIQSAKTDVNGLASISDLPAGKSTGTTQVFFRAEHPDYGTQTVLVREVPSTVDVVLRSPAIVEGQVLDIVAGGPAKNVVVDAQGCDRQIIDGGSGQTLTNEQGRFRLLLLPGTYNIWANMPDRTVVAFDSYVASKGMNPPADLKLINGGFITGRVLGRDGSPAKSSKDQRIVIGLHGPSRPQSGSAVESVPVNDDGTYRMRIPPGENYPYIMSGNFAADRDATNASESSPVVVEEGETKELDFHVRFAR